MNIRLSLLFSHYSDVMRNLKWPVLVLVLQVLPLVWAENRAWGEAEDWGDWAQEVEQPLPAGQPGPGAKPGLSEDLEAPERAQFEHLDGSDLGDYGADRNFSGDRDNAQADPHDHQHTLLQQMEQLELLERMEQSLGGLPQKIDGAQDRILLRTQSIETVGTRDGNAIEAMTPVDQDFNKSEVLDNFVSQFENLGNVTGSDADRDMPESIVSGSDNIDDEGVTLAPDLDQEEDTTLAKPGFDTLAPEFEHPVKD
ncbi:hypothetical protein HBA55_33660 [Pseudomaricurvus alkylphenolicus]|uniref:hypothetical protein n=1 Tax=Pseudomaricurvus alkylphenolicus TaxID=1306991 RepID=UPI00141E088C|nr:hypothetical protein [Pseudomaricurvus alkylphenolicus]NIB44584.1 hypothetical protein [Pseudomaricurvus alkylphenolicus]